MNNRTLLIGERVRIHPVTDWFMRGVTYGVITSKRETRGTTVYYVRPDTVGLHVSASLRMKLVRADIIAADDDTSL